MLHVLGNPRRFCDGVTRRQAMTAGALSVLGGAFNLPTLLGMEERRLAGWSARRRMCCCSICTAGRRRRTCLI